MDNFLADVMADFETVDEAAHDALVGRLVNRVGVGGGVEEGGVGRGAGVGGDIVVAAEAANVTRHIIRDTASGVNVDVLT